MSDHRPAPPQNIEVEQALLGAILMNNAALARVSSFLDHTHFFEPLHAHVFDLARGMIEAGRVTNPITLKTHLPADLDIGGLNVSQYLARLAAEATTVINAGDYGRTIFELAQLREIAKIGRDALEYRDHDRQADEALRIAYEMFDALRLNGTARESTTAWAGPAADQVVEHFTSIMGGTAQANTITTGLRDLDARTGGLKRGDLVVAAGRPGMGKSTLAGSVARMSAEKGHGALFFSLEMRRRHVTARILTDSVFDHRAPISATDVAAGRIDNAQAERLVLGARCFHHLPLVIDEASSLTVAEITAKTRSVAAEMQRRGQRLELVVIDYLKFIKASQRYNGQRHYEIGEITAGLKQLAKDLDVCVLLLAQLNREVA
jgi:replicative DNA helicase